MEPLEKKDTKCLLIYSTQVTEESTNKCKTNGIFLFGIVIVILCEHFVILTVSDEEKINF